MSVHQAHVEDAHYWRKRAEAAEAERDRLRAAVDHYLKAEEAWFLTTNARPFDAQASARASRIKHKALDDLAALAAFGVSETTKGAE